MMRSFISFLLLSLIVAFPITFMWQGLDVTDTGYTLTNCQQFFHAYPQDLSDPTVGSFWLSYLLGGLWYELTGGCGLIGFRAFYLLIIFGILGLAWLACRSFESNKALIALFAGSALVLAKSFYFPSYNEFTTLLFGATMLALYRGLVRKRNLWIFLGGVAAGASIFVRLPNLPIVGIVVAILFYRVIEAFDRRQFFAVSLRPALKECGVFISGYAAGVAFVLLAMAALGHLAAYFMTLRQMSAMFSDPTQHHGAWPLLKGLLHDYFYVVVAGATFLAGGIAIGRFAHLSSNRWFRLSLIALSAIGATFLLLRSSEIEIYFWPGVLYAVLLAGAIGLLNLSNEYRLLCVLAACVLFFTPLGSNNGIFNAVYAMPLVVPVAVLALVGSPKPAAHATEPTGGRAFANSSLPWPLWQSTYDRVRSGAATLDTQAVGYALLFTIIAFAGIHRWQFTYRDSSKRLAMHTDVDHPRLRHVFTTSSRAKSMDELLQHLRPLVGKGDYLMDHTQIPLIYFITETKPYLFSSWANLYSPPALERTIAHARLARTALPVCIRTKVDTCHPNWPDETYPPSESYRFAGNRRLVESFLQTNNYRKYWEDNAFEIWLPPSSRGRG